MRGWSMNLLARDKRVMPWRIEDEMKAVRGLVRERIAATRISQSK